MSGWALAGARTMPRSVARPLPRVSRTVLFAGLANHVAKGGGDIDEVTILVIIVTEPGVARLPTRSSDATAYVRRPDKKVKAVFGPSKLEAAVAYHEAGHAAVGFWERVANRLLTVSIVPDPEAGTLGHAKRGKFPRKFNADIDDPRLVERRLKPLVVMLYAGGLAENGSPAATVG